MLELQAQKLLLDLKCKFGFSRVVLRKEEKGAIKFLQQSAPPPKTDFCTSVTNQVFSILIFSNSNKFPTIPQIPKPN